MPDPFYQDPHPKLLQNEEGARVEWVIIFHNSYTLFNVLRKQLIYKRQNPIQNKTEILGLE